MKKIKFMLLFALLQIASTISIHAEIIKGDCGDNVTFTLDTETKLLEISGVGKISDFGSNNAPWYNVRTNIKNVKISNRIKYIGNYAFKDCSELTAINIPDSVTAIGAYAFNGCGKLTAIDVPGSVTIIGRCAFENCIRLADVKLSEGLESIGLYAFGGCEKLTTITIPSSMEKIGEYAFYKCSRLNTVKIPNSVETIGRYAFSGCSRLTSIELPNSVLSIEEYAFEDCIRLAEIKLPSSLEKIGYSAFYGCAKLASITIPDGMEAIDNNAFAYCTGLETISIPNSVETIGQSAFRNCSKLATITIPNSVESIGQSAFESCGKLATISIPNSVESIGQSAFQNCTSLTSITLPNSITAINAHTFEGCTNLAEVNLPNSVTAIYDCAFTYCDSLKTITIPSSTKVIYKNAFNHCTGLISIDIPNGVKSIQESAFTYCTNLKSVNIPNSVTTIGNNAFEGCDSLKSIVLPSSIKSIGRYAFRKCTGLMSINIPNSLTKIEDSAFSGCVGLTSINIPNSVTEIENSAFSSCAGLTSINIPNSVTSVGEYAFSYCTGLTSINISKNVTKIMGRAFMGCKRVKEVTIPNKTEYIGGSAFLECDSITDIFIYGEYVREINNNYSVFSEKTEKNAILHVPVSQLEGYKTTEPWSRFNNIVAIKDEEKPAEDTPTNYVFLAESKGAAGKDATLSLMMNNKVMVTGYQCDVYLPAGVTFAKGEDGFEKIELSTKRTTSKDTDYFSYRKQESGAMRILCSSTTNKTFSGNEGEVATMVVHLDKDLTPGEYPVILRNIVLSDPQAQTYRNDEMRAILTVVDYEVGDANGDKDINVGDFTAIANHIQGVTADNFIAEAADVNLDGIIDVGDLTGVASIILSASSSTNKARVAALEQTTANNLADYDNAVYPTDAKVQSDGTATISVCMKNSVLVTGYQFDMYLPEGFTYATDEDGYELIELSTERTTKRNTDFFSYRMQANGAMRVLCSSTKVKTFQGNDGEVCTVVVKAPENVKPGNYPVMLKNIVMSDPQAKTYKAENLSADIIVDPSTGIGNITIDNLHNCRIFSVDGKERQTLGKGINIIKTADGKVIKVMK